jgi:hypothetical protein
VEPVMTLVTFLLTYDYGRKVLVNPLEIASVVEMRQGSMIVMQNGQRYEVTDHLAEVERKCLNGDPS